MPADIQQGATSAVQPRTQHAADIDDQFSRRPKCSLRRLPCTIKPHSICWWRPQSPIPATGRSTSPAVRHCRCGIRPARTPRLRPRRNRGDAGRGTQAGGAIGVPNVEWRKATSTHCRSPMRVRCRELPVCVSSLRGARSRVRGNDAGVPSGRAHRAVRCHCVGRCAQSGRVQSHGTASRPVDGGISPPCFFVWPVCPRRSAGPTPTLLPGSGGAGG